MHLIPKFHARSPLFSLPTHCVPLTTGMMRTYALQGQPGGGGVDDPGAGCVGGVGACTTGGREAEGSLQDATTAEKVVRARAYSA